MTGETVRGIDVFVSRFLIALVIDIHSFRGTGASTIYPLLACKLSDNWNLIGTGMRLYEVSTTTTPEIIPRYRRTISSIRQCQCQTE